MLVSLSIRLSISSIACKTLITAFKGDSIEAIMSGRAQDVWLGDGKVLFVVTSVQFARVCLRSLGESRSCNSKQMIEVLHLVTTGSPVHDLKLPKYSLQYHRSLP